MTGPGAALPTEAGVRSLAERCVLRAIDKQVTFATAESCTGGLVAHLVTDIPGASTAFQGGWVVYDNARKSDDLGVPRALIDSQGAVSEPVARALADGARRRAGTTFGIATTGVAGPTGGSSDKPVGLVWLGLATPDQVHAEAFHQPDGSVRERVANKIAFAERALTLLAAAIEAYPDAPDLPLGSGARGA